MMYLHRFLPACYSAGTNSLDKSSAVPVLDHHQATLPGGFLFYCIKFFNSSAINP